MLNPYESPRVPSSAAPRPHIARWKQYALIAVILLGSTAIAVHIKAVLSMYDTWLMKHDYVLNFTGTAAVAGALLGTACFVTLLRLGTSLQKIFAAAPAAVCALFCLWIFTNIIT